MALTKEQIIAKHKKTPEQLELEKREQEKLKQEYALKNVEYEKNLIEYFSRTKPILDENGKPIALMRYPSYAELVSMIPPELRQYRNDPSKVPPDMLTEMEEKYADQQFEIIANLVVEPKKPADWWKRQSGILRFVKLFNDTFEEIVKETGMQATDFRTARKGKR